MADLGAGLSRRLGKRRYSTTEGMSRNMTTAWYNRPLPKKGCVMSCRLCAAENQSQHTSELMIHFSGLENVDHAGVLMFPKVLVCQDCGSAEFTITEAELHLLRQVKAASAA